VRKGVRPTLAHRHRLDRMGPVFRGLFSLLSADKSRFRGLDRSVMGGPFALESGAFPLTGALSCPRSWCRVLRPLWMDKKYEPIVDRGDEGPGGKAKQAFS